MMRGCTRWRGELSVQGGRCWDLGRALSILRVELFALQYSKDFEAMRHTPETQEELGMVHEAVDVIREAGLPQLVTA